MDEKLMKEDFSCIFNISRLNGVVSYLCIGNRRR